MARGIKLAATLAIFVIGLAVLLGANAANGTNGNNGKIENKVLRDTANGRQTSFVILLKDQANVKQGLRDEGPGRPRLVRLPTPKTEALRTQAPIRAYLTPAASPTGRSGART